MLFYSNMDVRTKEEESELTMTELKQKSADRAKQREQVSLILKQGIGLKPGRRGYTLCYL